MAGRLKTAINLRGVRRGCRRCVAVVKVDRLMEEELCVSSAGVESRRSSVTRKHRHVILGSPGMQKLLYEVLVKVEYW